MSLFRVEKIEFTWPDKAFAQFGGHVLERLLDLRREFAGMGDRRFKVTVRIEIDEQEQVSGIGCQVTDEPGWPLTPDT